MAVAVLIDWATICAIHSGFGGFVRFVTQGDVPAAPGLTLGCVVERLRRKVAEGGAVTHRTVSDSLCWWAMPSLHALVRVARRTFVNAGGRGAPYGW